MLSCDPGWRQPDAEKAVLGRAVATVAVVGAADAAVGPSWQRPGLAELPPGWLSVLKERDTVHTGSLKVTGHLRSGLQSH